jgi:hypothetical protein
MLNVIERFSKINSEVTDEQIDLFTRCFKYLVGVKRNQGRKIEVLIEKDTLLGNDKNLHLLKIIKNTIERESLDWSNRIITICQNYLQSDLNKNKKAKLFFLKNIADHYRYLYEIELERINFNSLSHIHNNPTINQSGNSKLLFLTNLTQSENCSCNSNSSDSKAISLSKVNEAYVTALQFAEKEKFFPTDTIYLTFFLNYCVFLHDVYDDREEAIKRAKAVLNAALKETEEITENNQKDIILICQTFKDNLSLWKIEMPQEF